MDYQDPQITAIYDMANPMAEDAEFYLSLAGPHSCSVLDLGCGTGTLCCALAKRGHRITGVDPAAAMLAVAKRKPHAQHVEWIESSAQIYRSPRRFDLIVMTGHAFQVLLGRYRYAGRIGNHATTSQAAAGQHLKLVTRTWTGLERGRRDVGCWPMDRSQKRSRSLGRTASLSRSRLRIGLQAGR